MSIHPFMSCKKTNFQDSTASFRNGFLIKCYLTPVFLTSALLLQQLSFFPVSHQAFSAARIPSGYLAFFYYSHYNAGQCLWLKLRRAGLPLRPRVGQQKLAVSEAGSRVGWDLALKSEIGKIFSSLSVCVSVHRCRVWGGKGQFIFKRGL